MTSSQLASISELIYDNYEAARMSEQPAGIRWCMLYGASCDGPLNVAVKVHGGCEKDCEAVDLHIEAFLDRSDITHGRGFVMEVNDAFRSVEVKGQQYVVVKGQASYAVHENLLLDRFVDEDGNQLFWGNILVVNDSSSSKSDKDTEIDIETVCAFPGSEAEDVNEDNVLYARLVGGGQVSQKLFSKTEITGHTSEYADGTKVNAAWYDFVAYVKKPELESMVEANPVLFGVELPLSKIVSHLLVEELKAVASHHGIVIGSKWSKKVITECIEAHQCCGCARFFSVFSPRGISLSDVKFEYEEEMFNRVKKNIRPFTFEELSALVNGDAEVCADTFKNGAVVSRLLKSGGHSFEDEWDAVALQVPWLQIAIKGSKDVVQLLAKIHGLEIAPRWSRRAIVDALICHRCVSCPLYVVVFKALAQGRARQASASQSGLPDRRFALTEAVSDPVPFPPRPPSLKDLADMAREVYSAFDPSNIEESGCTVCGQLVLRSKLLDVESCGVPLDPLRERGVARKERFCYHEAVVFEEGPIRDYALSEICVDCLECLHKSKRPVNTLANALWVGSVPDVLQGLTFIEQLLVARVRHNRCVVRVSTGATKMVANAIAFESPTPHIYKALPPPKRTLNEVLAFIFTGMRPPSDDDLERTPMLVRRNHVRLALEWLVLNHADYADVRIDRESLDSYDERGVPVKVIFWKDETGTNLFATATSVNERQEEEGTESGNCPFHVHGLTGERLSTMTVEAKKMAAMLHVRNGGHVLGIGQSSSPKSMYDNLKLYPSMFPWLFPYGLGGLGHSMHVNLVSEQKRKQLLLMYHDKRFQADPHFVIVAFNHQQTKSSSLGSFLMTKRSDFHAVSHEL
ncbi:hypothetical protein BKA70DRAFT_1447936 [Coprinopsis sp. MPI-PUGE-AT-0042]|nr:hypothetical protein BKA70DRAFT_1447936 [Coprinopsis sp. MPI-PUGE-AT-0042]